ncbi:thiol-disulfide oxidoreductase DCC family protein [Saccharopolyspora shandongensis]|uniref:thiol-disulfide oxidoreductase DCC family protein n=1 Tax=Saccharopolyspora shandongensis TaxID=418495 RepID=UPI0033D8B650
MADLPVLIYDGDCGFCTRSVRLAERLPVRMRILPWQEADLAALRTTSDRARHEVLWVARSGRVFGGAAAVAELLKNCRTPWPVLGLLMSAPVLRLLAEWAYRGVAANRYRLPGATPACQLPPAERPGHSARS